MIFSGDCYEFSGAENAFEEDEDVFEGVDYEFPDDQCFCGVVSEDDGDLDILKIYLRTKNE